MFTICALGFVQLTFYLALPTTVGTYNQIQNYKKVSLFRNNTRNRPLVTTFTFGGLELLDAPKRFPLLQIEPSSNAPSRRSDCVVRVRPAGPRVVISSDDTDVLIGLQSSSNTGS